MDWVRQQSCKSLRMFVADARNVGPYPRVLRCGKRRMMGLVPLQVAGGSLVGFPELVGRACGHVALDMRHEALKVDEEEDANGKCLFVGRDDHGFQHFVARIVALVLVTRPTVEIVASCGIRESRCREVRVAFGLVDGHLIQYVVAPAR